MPLSRGPLAPHASRLRRWPPAAHVRYHGLIVAFSSRPLAVAQRIVRRALERAEGWPPAAVLLETRTAMLEHEAFEKAAGIAYYGLFSLFPLLLGLIALLSLFLDPAAVEAQLVDLAARYLPGTEQVVVQNVEGIVQSRGALGLASILGLLWSGSAVFGVLTRALDRAWGTHTAQPFYITGARRVALALGVGGLLALTMTATTFVHMAEEFSALNEPALGFLRGFFTRWGLESGSLLSSLLLLVLLYQFSTTQRIPWRHLWPGALLAGLLFELAKTAFVLYLTQFASFQRVYGSVASVIALLLWVYVSVLILILGAEFGATLHRWRRGELLSFRDV